MCRRLKRRSQVQSVAELGPSEGLGLVSVLPTELPLLTGYLQGSQKQHTIQTQGGGQSLSYTDTPPWARKGRGAPAFQGRRARHRTWVLVGRPTRLVCDQAQANPIGQLSGLLIFVPTGWGPRNKSRTCPSLDEVSGAEWTLHSAPGVAEGT